MIGACESLSGPLKTALAIRNEDAGEKCGRRGSALFREQLLQFVYGHSAAVLAEFETLGMLDLLTLFGAIAFFERGPHSV